MVEIQTDPIVNQSGNPFSFCPERFEDSSQSDSTGSLETIGLCSVTCSTKTSAQVSSVALPTAISPQVETHSYGRIRRREAEHDALVDTSGSGRSTWKQELPRRGRRRNADRRRLSAWKTQTTPLSTNPIESAVRRSRCGAAQVKHWRRGGSKSHDGRRRPP